MKENVSSSQNSNIFKLEELNRLILNHKFNTGRLFCFDIVEMSNGLSQAFSGWTYKGLFVTLNVGYLVD